MKIKIQTVTLLSLLTLCFASAAETTSPHPNNLATRVVIGQSRLEGPAITGPKNKDASLGEESETGAGLQLEVERHLTPALFLKGQAEWMRYGNDPGFDFTRLSLGLGGRRDLGLFLGLRWQVHGILSLEYARSGGLSGFAGNPDFGGLGTGKSGDDTGFGVEGGLLGRLSSDWSFLLFGKYHDFGNGSGPGFGFRAEYTLTESWDLQAGWEGLWVEDAGYQIDIDTQRFTFSVSCRF